MHGDPPATHSAQPPVKSDTADIVLEQVYAVWAHELELGGLVGDRLGEAPFAVITFKGAACRTVAALPSAPAELLMTGAR